ncbi:hypothetical protein C8Q70DRAFT_948162, partial [Cubamyces menziesii]
RCSRHAQTCFALLLCLTCLTCLTKPGQACVWFDTRLLPWAGMTTLVFGTRPRSPLPATDVRVPSSFSNKCPLPILAKDRNIDVMTAPRFSLSPAAPPRVSTFTCLPPTIISILTSPDAHIKPCRSLKHVSPWHCRLTIGSER